VTDCQLTRIVPEAPDLVPVGFAAAVCRILATEDSIERVDEGKRRLEALRHYITDREKRLEVQAAERWCEVRIGELLGPTKQGGNGVSLASETLPSKDDRYRFRLMAEHRDMVADLIDAGHVTRAKILDVIETKKRGDKAADEGDFEGVVEGDFREVLTDDVIAPGSVDLVLTDPPYAEKYLELWDDLGAFATRVLRPGGSLVAYSGQAVLREVLNRLHRHLRDWWILSLDHKHGGTQLPGKWVLAEWKPIVWFVKDYREGRSYVADTVSGAKPRKDAHEWAQGTAEAVYLIQQLTEPGALVVDPFSGSGTVSVAAAQTGRRFVGAEINPRK
jgi:site-specific DNA-methyltransferase (adenine-specific)